MKLMISEILENTSKLKTKEEQINYLRKNDNTPLRIIIQSALHPQVKFLLPEGAPPFTPCPTGEAQGMLFSEARKMYLFVEGSNVNLNKTKRENLFITMLESVDPKDAELLIAMKDKKLPYPIQYDVRSEEHTSELQSH